MNPIANRPEHGRLPRHAAGVLLMLLTLAPASAQSPAELVESFSSDDPHYSILDRMGLSPCARANAREVAEREALRKLSAYGPVALPALELALDSFARDASQSRYALGIGWLLHAYASIRGAGAELRLEALAKNPRLESYQRIIDAALATAFGYTSVISARLTDVRVFCSSPHPPRALDQVILALKDEGDDTLGRLLAPPSREELQRLMAEPAWPALRAALQSSRGWRYRGTTQSDSPEEGPVAVQFFHEDGRACASVAVRFPRSEGMRVQPESVAALLQALTRCGGAAGGPLPLAEK